MSILFAVTLIDLARLACFDIFPDGSTHMLVLLRVRNSTGTPECTSPDVQVAMYKSRCTSRDVQVAMYKWRCTNK